MTETYAGVAQAMRDANSFRALLSAAERIQHVPGGASAQVGLHKIFKQRSNALKGK